MEEDEESSHGREVVREMDTLRAENKVLCDYSKQKIIVLDKYERELKRYRSQAFLKGDYLGVRHYSEEPIEILRGRGFVDSYRHQEDLVWI